MSNTNETTSLHASNMQAAASAPTPIVDAGKVRLGGQGPVFRLASIRDSGAVRLGGQGPVFRRHTIADAGRVRLGGQGPIFR